MSAVPADWPHVNCSQFVHSGGMRWHVQQLGDGDTVFVLHGTGASTHSMAPLAAELAQHYRVVLCDLPGHGFSSQPQMAAMRLPAMTRLLRELLRTLNIKPDYLIGHSAGAALCCQLVLDGALRPRCVVAINGALLPFGGVAGQLFGPLAQMLAVNPTVPRMVSWRARRNHRMTRRLLHNTGSAISEKSVYLYNRLLAMPAHVAGALKMMANWDLVSFARKLPGLNRPLYLLVASNDQTVLPDQSRTVCQRVASASFIDLGAYGHLVHEEVPEQLSQCIRQLFCETVATRTVTDIELS
jgi:magnesium chelatase accessory protein